VSIEGGASMDPVLLDAPHRVGPALARGGGEMVTIATAARADGGGGLTKFSLASGDLRIDTASLPVEEWPDDHLPPAGAEPLFAATFGAEALAALRRVAPAISTEETRYYLNGVHICPAEGGGWGWTMVATDGHRMHVAEIPLADGTGTAPPDGIILPAAAVRLLLRFAGPDEPVRFELLPRRARNRATGPTLDVEAPTMEAPTKSAPAGVDPAIARFTMPGRLGVEILVLTSKTIDGTFPKWRAVVPKDPPHIATVERAALRRAVATAVALAETRRGAVALKLSFAPGGRLEVTLRWHEGAGEASIGLPYDGMGWTENHGRVFEVGMNARYLAGILDAFDGCERVSLAFCESEFDGKTGPSTFDPITIASNERDGFMAILMPMRV